MSDRKGHYVKPGVRVSTPGVLFALHATTVQSRTASGTAVDVQTLERVYGCVSYHRRGHWSKPLEVETGSGEELREWMRYHSILRRINWVVCPIASSVLTLTRWWEYAEHKGIEWVPGKARGKPAVADDPRRSAIVASRIVVSGTPDIVDYSDDGQSWRWVSGRNYFPDGIPFTADNSRAGAADRGPDQETGAPPRIRAARTARDWLAAISRLCDWWRANALTPFAPTVGALAYGFLRSTAPPKTLCTHNDEDVHRLERAAAYGGRASVWFVGNIGQGVDFPEQRDDDEGNTTFREVNGPVHHLDVRSMYAHLLGNNQFPVKLIEYRESTPVSVACESALGFGVIARVTLRTSHPEYPTRVGERVGYPVGRFTTVLTGPELLKAQSDSTIDRVHEMAVYKLARPFEEFSRRLIAARVTARRNGNGPDESIAKLLANSLAGKLAQRRGQWQRRRELDEPGRWGEHHILNMDTGGRRRTRYIAGFCWEWEADETGYGPHTAAFAYLAAYGRLQMRAIRKLCPAGTVVSQDTDGIFVLPPALETLRSVPGLMGGAAGQLRLIGTTQHARFFGPRHYVLGDQWTLSGFHNPKIDISAMRVRDTVSTSLWGARPRRAPDSINTITRDSTLLFELCGGTLRPDGWIEAEQLHLAEPDDDEPPRLLRF